MMRPCRAGWLGIALSGAALVCSGPLLSASQFIRGDANRDGRLDISDPVKVLFHLLLGQPVGCLDAADANDSGDLNVTDSIYLLLFYFVGGPAPPAPFPDCGVDPVEDSLGCEEFLPCTVIHENFITRAGGTFAIPWGGQDRVAVAVPPDLFGWRTGMAGEAGIEPAPLWGGGEAPLLPVVRLRFDGLHLDSFAAAGPLSFRLPRALLAALPGSPPEAREATVFIATGKRQFFYTLPLEPAVDDGGPSPDQPPDQILSLPAPLFQKAREWGLAGRGGLVDATPVVIAEILEGGLVRLDLGGQPGDGRLEFRDEGKTAVIEMEIGGSPRILEVASPPCEVTLEVVPGWISILYQRLSASLDGALGPGKLYRISFADLSLAEVKALEPLDPADSAWVLAHGWDLADPFRALFALTFTGLELRPVEIPGSEEEIRARLVENWAALLGHLNRAGAGPVYLYAYNPLRGVHENGAALAARLREAFDWRSRKAPIIILGHSTGGLVGAGALASEFGLDDPLPRHPRLIALAAPFRGTPLANRFFQEEWRANGFKRLLEAARPLWLELDRDGRRQMPVELLGSLIGAAAFFSTAYPGARDADLDALWAALGKPGLDDRLLLASAEAGGPRHPLPLRLAHQLLAAYQDPFVRKPYARNDGLAPLASALRRPGLSDAFWFSVEGAPPSGRERNFPGEDNGSMKDSAAVFEDLGLGSGAFENSIGMRLRYVPPGSFLMGSALDSRARRPDEAQHLVHLTRGIYLGEKEVTQAQYQQVMGANPSFFASEPDSAGRPVDSVSWDEAVKFCERLTARERAATAIRPDERYRLPSEAEWEYACRADTTARFSFGEVPECGDATGLCAAADPYAWWLDNSGRKTQLAGRKGANPWGFQDLHGNVLEWCQDWYGPYPEGEAANPAGPATGTARVLRGGDWRGMLQLCRSACRGNSLPTGRGSNFGFRVALAVEP